MKITGYSEADVGLPPEEVRFVDLAEITIAATPVEARRLSEYFAHVASEMERMGSGYSHAHLADRQPGFENSPHVTVFNSELSE